jgi:anti-sigma regulatory factor (Ser/Thr protein kinase)
MVGLERDPFRVRLPKISAVSRGYRTDGGGSRFDFDLVGYGFLDADYSEDKMVAWAVDVAPGKTLTQAAVEHFENRSRLLALEKALPPERIRKWLIFGESVDPGALELAAAAGIHLTHRSQLRLFMNLFGIDEGQPPAALPDGAAPPAPPAAAPAAEVPDGAVEFTLVLPMKADTELVAARVAEEVAVWASLDADSVDRIKMAIIEACINAFEHSGSDTGRVQVRYVLSPGRIEIFVRDDGRGIRPGEGAGSGKHRGWGLKLMRELVDEVAVETGDAGTVVRLVKFVDRLAPDRSGAVDAG